MSPTRSTALRPAGRADVVALAALALLAAVQVWPLAGPGRLPQNLDLMLQYVPNAAYLARGLAAGHVPLWNPYQGTGMPFAADPGTGAWYLPNWLPLLLLPLDAAARMILWFHLLLAAAGTYLYLRFGFRASATAAWIGAAAYALTTWLPGLTGMAAVLTAVAWLPWIVLLAQRAASRGGRWTAVLAIAGGLQILAGWPAGAYLAWLAAGWLVVSRHSWRRWPPVALGAVGAALLAGILLVPAVEFVLQTNYAETRPLERVSTEGYLTLLSWLRPAGGSGSLESSQLYVGMAPLVLALVGAVFGRRPDCWRHGTLTLVALLLAFGTHGPLFAALYRYLPGFRIVYLPARLGIVAAFGLACLAALGVERLVRGRWRLRDALSVALLVVVLPVVLLAQFWLSEGYDNFRRLLTNLGRVAGGPFLSRTQEAHYALFGVLALGVLLWLALRQRHPAATPAHAGAVATTLLAVLTAADLILAQVEVHPAAYDPVAWYAPARDTAAALGPSLGSGRVTGLQWRGGEHFLDDFPVSAAAALLPPNLATYAGVRDPAAYNPLLLRRAVAYFNGVTLGQRDDHWLWVDDFQSPAAAALALRGVLLVDQSWRVVDHRLALPVRLPPDGSAQTIWSGTAPGATRLRILSYLGEATQVPQGTPAIELLLRSTGGVEQRVLLRAGLDTAEWAYGRSDVRATVRHQQAPIALETRLQGAVEGRFAVYQYESVQSVDLAEPLTEIRGRSLVPNVTGFVEGIYAEPLVPPEIHPLEGSTQLLLLPASSDRANMAGGTVTLVRDEPEVVEAHTASAVPGQLVFADAFYPGWTATVDGRPATISPADGLFRAVDVPAGTHVVAFAYRPRSLLLGAALSALGAVLCVALFWLDAGRHQAATNAAQPEANSRPINNADQGGAA